MRDLSFFLGGVFFGAAVAYVGVDYVYIYIYNTLVRMREEGEFRIHPRFPISSRLFFFFSFQGYSTPFPYLVQRSVNRRSAAGGFL